MLFICYYTCGSFCLRYFQSFSQQILRTFDECRVLSWCQKPDPVLPHVMVTASLVRRLAIKLILNSSSLLLVTLYSLSRSDPNTSCLGSFLDRVSQSCQCFHNTYITPVINGEQTFYFNILVNTVSCQSTHLYPLPRW